MALDVFSWRALLLLCIAAMTGAVGAGLWLLWRARARPFVRATLLLALAIEGLLALAYLASLRNRWPVLLEWLANVNAEYTPGTLFSSAQLLVAGVTALVCAATLRDRGWPGRVFLLATGSALLFLGLDEFFAIHESLWQLTPELTPFGPHLWRALYVAGGCGLTLALLLAWRLQYRRLWRVFAAMLLGLAVTGISGIAIEHVTLQAFCQTSADGSQWQCDNPQQWLVFEEIFEIVGVSLTLGGLLVFAQERLPARAWRRLTRIVPVAGALTIAGLALYLWLLPLLELQLTATPANVNWYGGNLVLQGVRVDGSPAAAGAEISVWLYWQRLGKIPKNLHLSLHALERPGLAQSLASSEQDDLGQYATEGWMAGVPVRKRLTLRLPEALETPGSLALMLRVWRGNWAQGEIQGVAVDRSDRQVLGQDQVVIGSVAVPGPGFAGGYAAFSEARFDKQLALEGYTLPDEAEAGDELTLTLYWQVLEAPPVNYTQFLHLQREADAAFVAGFDEQPFGGRFPSVDWPADQALRDVWRIQLPPELAAGDYRLVYGLYNSQTLERLPLAVAGAALPDGLLPLGALRVGAEE